MDYISYVSLFFVLPGMIYRWVKKYSARRQGPCKSKARMDGKTVIVTGANTGIGKETVLDLARRGARVIMACRDLKRGEAALKDIVEKTGNTKVVLKQLDLASMKSIRNFAQDINNSEPQLHVLINNAGFAYPSQLTRTEDGFEMTMGVNHLGHFLLTNLLLDLLKKSTPSRIVVVSSRTHAQYTKEMKFHNINSETFYDKWDAYGQSKLANVLFTRELAKRLQGSGVTVNALHPGIIMTDIFRRLSTSFKFVMPLVSMFCKTVQEGAQTTIHLAVSEEIKGVSGLYFVDCEPKEPSKYAQNDEAAKKLWNTSTDLVELGTTI